MTEKEIEDWDSIDVRYVTPQKLAETAIEAAEEDADEVMLIADVDVEALVEEYQAEQAEEEDEELEAPWLTEDYPDSGLTAEEFLKQSDILNEGGDNDE